MLELFLANILNNSTADSEIADFIDPKYISIYRTAPSSPNIINPGIIIPNLPDFSMPQALHIDYHKKPEQYVFHTKIKGIHIFIKQKIPKSSANCIFNAPYQN